MKLDLAKLDPRKLDLKKLDLKKVSRAWWIVGGVALFVIVAIIVFSGRSSAAEGAGYQTIQVRPGTLTSTVGATGSVRASQSTVLTWQTSGRVEAVNVEIGDKVTTDQVLASLAQTSLPQTVITAEADLVSAQSALDTLMQSNTAAAQAEQAVVTAQQALSDAQKKVASMKYPRATQALIDNTYAKINLANRSLAKAADKYRQTKHLPDSNPDKATAEMNLTNAQLQLNQLKANYNYYTGKPSELEIAAANAAFVVAQAQLEDAQRAYERVKNGPAPEDIAAAKANVAAAQATLNQAKIITPFDGVITEADTNPGDIVSEGTAAFRIDNLSHLLVDVQVSEVDINNVEIGQPASLTFDAIQGKTYEGKVVKVNQAGDISSNNSAVSFTVTVELTNGDANVKPGMSTTVSVIVKQLKNVLLVPNRAVTSTNNRHIVYVLKNGTPTPVEVQVGASSDTATEIVSGLKAGDTVVLNPSGTTTTSSGNQNNTRPGGGFGGGIRIP